MNAFDRQSLFCNVMSQVGNSLQVVGKFNHGDHISQVFCHRIESCDDFVDSFLYLSVEVIDGIIQI